MRQRSDWIARLLAAVFIVPRVRHIALDEVGTFVWRACDGKKTVDEVATLLARAYKLDRKEAELSLTTYLRTLGRRGLVALLVSER